MGVRVSITRGRRRRIIAVVIVSVAIMIIAIIPVMIILIVIAIVAIMIILIVVAMSRPLIPARHVIAADRKCVV